jgi:hypothetical protein
MLVVADPTRRSRAHLRFHEKHYCRNAIAAGLIMTDLIELLEMRVSRLERIVAANSGGPGSNAKLPCESIHYGMDDPRLVLFGAYALESAPNKMSFRWFGKDSLVQMVFPHGRAARQNVRLLVRAAAGVELAEVRVIVDELNIAPQLTPASGGLMYMSFQIPAAFGNQTEIQMKDVPVASRKIPGMPDGRPLSFAVYKAEFSAVPEDPPQSAAAVGAPPAKGRTRKGRS